MGNDWRTSRFADREIGDLALLAFVEIYIKKEVGPPGQRNAEHYGHLAAEGVPYGSTETF